MEKCTSTIPAQPAIDLGDDTLVITLEEVVSPAEKTPPRAVADAIQMREIYRQFIADALASADKRLLGLGRSTLENVQVVTLRARPSGRRRRLGAPLAVRITASMPGTFVPGTAP
jgi:hypothetical protein